MSSSDPLPEQATIQGELSAFIQNLLGHLDENYRLAVIYRYWYQYSYAEIAVAMDTTESAIKSRLHRARKKLGELLDARTDISADGDDRLADPQPKGF